MPYGAIVRIVFAMADGTSKKESYERLTRALLARRFLLPHAFARITLPVPVILNRFATLLRVFNLGTICSTFWLACAL